MAGRFTDLPYETFVAGQENKETLRKTLSNINLVREFLQGSGETRPIEEIPPQELDGYLASFFVNVRTRSGSDYEPSTLRGTLKNPNKNKFQTPNKTQEILYPISTSSKEGMNEIKVRRDPQRGCLLDINFTNSHPPPKKKKREEVVLWSIPLK